LHLHPTTKAESNGQKNQAACWLIDRGGVRLSPFLADPVLTARSLMFWKCGSLKPILLEGGLVMRGTYLLIIALAAFVVFLIIYLVIPAIKEFMRKD